MESIERLRCKGITEHGGSCMFRAVKGELYCQRHAWQGEKPAVHLVRELDRVKRQLREVRRQHHLCEVRLAELRGLLRPEPSRIEMIAAALAKRDAE